MENILYEALNRKVNVEEIKGIVENNPNICQIKDEYGNLPIHLAIVMKSDFSIIKLFADIYVESLLCEDSYGYLPINYAILYTSSDEIIFYLLHLCPEACRKRIQSDSLFNNHYTLHLSLKCKCSYDIIYAVLSAYPDAVNVEVNGSLPIHIAIEYNSNSSIIHHLLDLNPMICQIRDKTGNFPLHVLCGLRNEDMDLFHRIVSIYPQACEIGNDDNRLPLHVYSKCKVNTKVSVKVIKLLVQTYPKACNFQDNEKNLPVHYFIMNRFNHYIPSDDELRVVCYLLKPISKDNVIVSHFSERLPAFNLKEKRRQLRIDNIIKLDKNIYVTRLINNLLIQYLSGEYIQSYHNLNWNARRVFFRILFSSSSSSSSSSTHIQSLVHILSKLKHQRSSSSDNNSNHNQDSFPSMLHSDLIRTIILFL